MTVKYRVFTKCRQLAKRPAASTDAYFFQEIEEGENGNCGWP